MPLNLDEHDQSLVNAANAAMKNAVSSAHAPVMVAKRISVLAVARRNRGRREAIQRYPFKGICEASGLQLDETLATLQQLEPKKGFEGKLRWVCPRANNSGKPSCGKC